MGTSFSLAQQPLTFAVRLEKLLYFHAFRTSEEGIMLFLVQLHHDAAHCPGYNRELMPQWIGGLERRDEIAAQMGVKLHAW